MKKKKLWCCTRKEQVLQLFRGTDAELPGHSAYFIQNIGVKSKGLWYI